MIFTTAYDEYAMQAFELNSIDCENRVNGEKLKNAMDNLGISARDFGGQNENETLLEVIRSMKVGGLVGSQQPLLH